MHILKEILKIKLRSFSLLFHYRIHLFKRAYVSFYSKNRKINFEDSSKKDILSCAPNCRPLWGLLIVLSITESVKVKCFLWLSRLGISVQTKCVGTQEYQFLNECHLQRFFPLSNKMQCKKLRKMTNWCCSLLSSLHTVNARNFRQMLRD